VDRLRLVPACAFSLLVHFGLLLLCQSFMIAATRAERLGSGGALLVDLVPSAAPHSVEPPRPEARPVAPPPPPPPARPAPRVRAPSPPRALPRYIDGVKIATAEDVVRHAERERAPSAPVAPPAPPPPPAPAPQSAIAEQPAAPPSGSAGSPQGSPQGEALAQPPDDNPYRGQHFRADTPGYNGRIFGQVSIKSSAAADSFYGRIHLFREDSTLRDYSKRSLFGYSFRQRLGETATREFETGRVTTPGAYLLVTDLFGDGHLSTMSHTVLFVFPRRPPAGGRALYDVVDEPGGDFRLRGPGGSSLVFDGHTGALREARGFAVQMQGESGTPPRVAYRGLHLRLHAVGSNPFLRDRPATAVDQGGRECELSTSEIFAYAGRNESDVFRFKNDSEFFSFLRDRCPFLQLPEPAPTLVAKAERKPRAKKKADDGDGRGLLPLLFRGLH
jgi:hypothetical protein